MKERSEAKRKCFYRKQDLTCRKQEPVSFWCKHMQKPNFDPINALNQRRNRSRFLICAVAALLVGCGLLTEISRAQEEPILPPGAYRLEMIMASTTRVPVFGTSKSASKSVSLVEIKRDGAALIQTHKACDFRVIDDSKFIKMIFPDKFVAALARHTYALQLDKDAQGWRYRADLGVERIGYKSSGNETALPSKIDDPAVYDWDGDGKPAATLRISIPLLPDGEFYVVQRGHSILNGRVVQPGRIEGSIETRLFEQRVLGAWPSFLNQSAEVEPDPKESRFVLTQVAAGSTCETLLSAGKS